LLNITNEIITDKILLVNASTLITDINLIIEIKNSLGYCKKFTPTLLHQGTQLFALIGEEACPSSTDNIIIGVVVGVGGALILLCIIIIIIVIISRKYSTV